MKRIFTPPIKKSNYEGLFLNYLTSFNYYEERMIGLMNDIIALHGKEEWKAVTLTHELHGHIGIFSILGAKMGIRAMEFFNTGKKQLKVISHAGFRPPVSCMNDGLQASIGATVGNNLLTIEPQEMPLASANFIYSETEIRITLNETSVEELKESISKAPGLPSKENLAYWKFIEELSFRYWLEWERDKIFDVKLLSKS
jgi:pyrimidine-specific ribonucleoside hydrolase